MTITENKLFWAKGHEDTIIPTKRDEDMGYDIYPRFDQHCIIIKPHNTTLIPTSLHCAMSSDYGLELGERGSTGAKGIKVSAGKIDSGYRGEIFVALTNTNDIPVVISKMSQEETDKAMPSDCNYIYYPYSKAICQGILVEVPKLQSEEITLDELLAIDSERGQGKLGDSGK